MASGGFIEADQPSAEDVCDVLLSVIVQFILPAAPPCVSKLQVGKLSIILVGLTLNVGGTGVGSGVGGGMGVGDGVGAIVGIGVGVGAAVGMSVGDGGSITTTEVGLDAGTGVGVGRGVGFWGALVGEG